MNVDGLVKMSIITSQEMPLGCNEGDWTFYDAINVEVL
jgi:hypothetical protein